MINWHEHKSHRDWVIRTRGQWVGLLDENGVPICDVDGVVDISAPHELVTAASATVTLSPGVIAPTNTVIDSVFATNLGVVDEDARLVPFDDKPKFICVERPGMRRVFLIVAASAEGVGAPTKFTLSCVDIVNYLYWWPCPSSKRGWSMFNPLDVRARGFMVQTVGFATTADGYSVEGPAIPTFEKLVDRSLRLVNQRFGWVQSHMFVARSDNLDPGPRVVIRCTDESLGDTIAGHARDAGVSFTVDMWFPGDLPEKVYGDKLGEWPHPVMICRFFLPESET